MTVQDSKMERHEHPVSPRVSLHPRSHALLRSSSRLSNGSFSQAPCFSNKPEDSTVLWP